MSWRRAIEVPGLVAQSAASWRAGRSAAIPGMQFDSFGRRLGARLLLSGDRSGARLLLNPVSIFRYFEFEFCAGHLPSGAVLDVGSPRLLPLWIAARAPGTVTMVNPDPEDIRVSRRVADQAGIRLQTRCAGADVAGDADPWDAVVSVSVVEHINGAYDDTAAVRHMWDALAPGGTLLLTVPVDRRFWDEYRQQSAYGADHDARRHVADSEVFFQRHYDLEALRRRLIEPLGATAELAWFGEREPGYYAEYARRWVQDGLRATVKDPAEIAQHFQRFGSWDEMPGRGVCGLKMVKGT